MAQSVNSLQFLNVARFIALLWMEILLVEPQFFFVDNSVVYENSLSDK